MVMRLVRWARRISMVTMSVGECSSVLMATGLLPALVCLEVYGVKGFSRTCWNLNTTSMRLLSGACSGVW